MLKRAAFIFGAFVLAGFVVAPVLADIATIQKTGTVFAKNDTVLLRCPGGQSTAIVSAASTVSGTVTVYTAADVGGVPGPTGSPYLSLPAHSNTYTTAITAPGKLYVTLASDQWVAGVYSSPNPAATGSVTITCSGAVAPFPAST